MSRDTPALSQDPHGSFTDPAVLSGQTDQQDRQQLQLLRVASAHKHSCANLISSVSELRTFSLLPSLPSLQLRRDSPAAYKALQRRVL